MKKCGRTYQFQCGNSPSEPLRVSVRCAVAAAGHPIHSSALQDSRLSAPNVTGIIYSVFVINIEAGGWGVDEVGNSGVRSALVIGQLSHTVLAFFGLFVFSLFFVALR